MVYRKWGKIQYYKEQPALSVLDPIPADRTSRICGLWFGNRGHDGHRDDIRAGEYMKLSKSAILESDDERLNRTKENWDVFLKQLRMVVVHSNILMARVSSIWMMGMRSFWKPGVTMVRGVSVSVNVEEAYCHLHKIVNGL